MPIPKIQTKLETVIDHEATGLLCRTWRQLNSVPRSHVAISLGYSRPYICMLENGKKAWSKELLARYIAAVKALKKKYSK